MKIGSHDFRELLLKYNIKSNKDGFYYEKDIKILEEYTSMTGSGYNKFQNICVDFFGGKKVFYYKKQEHFDAFHAIKHNLNGAAVIHADGSEEFYIFGEKTEKEAHQMLVKKLTTIMNFM